MTRVKIRVSKGLCFSIGCLHVKDRLPGKSVAFVHFRVQECCCFKARIHRRFLSQQLDAIFVALKLQLQNRRCKPGAICRRDIAGVSNMFET